MKKILCFILSISIIISIFGLPANMVFAETAKVKTEAESMQRLMDLGIFSQTEPGKMNLSEHITREQFAVVLVLINGQQDKLDSYKNISLFSDVPTSRWSNPYINVAVKSGFMTAMSSGRFSPSNKVDFNTAGVILGKLLNYDDAYLPGNTNKKYLIKNTTIV